MTDWRPGAVVDGLYEVRDVISTGGMGLVYRVLHRGWQVELAVKAPRPRFLASPQGIRDFEAEAATWVGLGEHPHTVTCVYVRRLADVPRVFAEWVDGGTLADAVRDGAFDLRRVLDVAIQTAWGLEHAHRNRVVHQDVKPANVLLTRDGVAKVSDFGLAKARAAAGESTQVPPGGSVLAAYGGLTPAYCSPEQAAAAWEDSGATLTRATDAWSWALTVLTMLTGRPPCDYGPAGGEVFAEFVAAGDHTLPASLISLLSRCFTVDPADRPRDLGALAGELIAVHEEVFGEPYPRQAPRSAVRLADELSNQALSMRDLGQHAEAEALWQRALANDSRNPHVVYNRGLHLWRTGQLTDVRFLADLAALGGDHAHHLAGLVHLERGDVAAARDELRAAPTDPAALALAERTPLPAPTVTLRGPRKRVRAVDLSGDGRFAVSVAEDGIARLWDLETRQCVRQVRLDGLTDPIADADHRRVTTRRRDGAVVVHDLTGNGPTRVLVNVDADEEAYGCHGYALTADGALVITATDEGTVRVWDAATGHTRYALRRGPLGEGFSGPVAMSADGTVAVAIGGTDRGLINPRPYHAPTGRGLVVWNPRSGKARDSYVVDGRFDRVGLSADGRVAVTEHDVTPRVLTMRVWDLAARELRHEITRNIAEQQKLRAVSADGRYAVCGAYYMHELWDLGQPRSLREWRTGATAAAFRRDGRFLAIGDSDGTITIEEVPPDRPAPWSYARSRPATERRREGDVVRQALDRSAAAMARGEFAAAADEVRAARALPAYQRHHDLLDRWRELARHGTRTTLTGAWLSHVIEVTGMHPTELTADGTVLVRRGDNLIGTVAWDVRDGSRRWAHQGRGGSLTMSGDGRTVMATDGGELGVWDAHSGEERHRLAGCGATLALNADGTTGISIAEGGRSLVVWDLVAGAVVHEMSGHTDHVLDVQLSADGRVAATNTGPHAKDRTIRIWDVRAGECGHVLRADDWGHNTFALSEAGNVLVSNHNDGTIRVWDTATGQCRQVLKGHRGTVFYAIPTAAGDTVVSVGRSRMRIWDGRTGECRHDLRNKKSATWPRPVISADGRFVVTGDGAAVRVWDTATGECVRTLDGHAEELRWLGLDAGGHVVVGVEVSHRAYVWELDWEYSFGP